MAVLTCFVGLEPDFDNTCSVYIYIYIYICQNPAQNVEHDINRESEVPKYSQKTHSYTF